MTSRQVFLFGFSSIYLAIKKHVYTTQPLLAHREDESDFCSEINYKSHQFNTTLLAVTLD